MGEMETEASAAAAGAGAGAAAVVKAAPSCPAPLVPTDSDPMAEQQQGHRPSVHCSSTGQHTDQHQQANSNSACAHHHHDSSTLAGAAAPPVQPDAEPAVAAARAAAVQLAEAAQQMARAAEGLAAAWVSHSSPSSCCAKGCCPLSTTHGSQRGAQEGPPPAPCSTAPSHPCPAHSSSPHVDVGGPQLSCSAAIQPLPSAPGMAAWQARQQAAADLGAAAAAATAAGARATSASFEAMRIVVRGTHTGGGEF
eukprot:scaffold127077_cov18-Tisochrysis_lutea.AAC.4